MKLKILLPIYSLILTAECWAIATNNLSLQLIAKPLLMLILIGYFVSRSRDFATVKNLIVAALFFSWIGDAVLLLNQIYGNLFVFGLISFLIAHLFYIYYFRQIGKLNAADGKLRFPAIIGTAIYSAMLYLYLFPHLGAMQIPVLVYTLIISLMFIACFHAFKSIEKLSAKLCLAGTIIFVVSDSILAINRFALPFSAAPVLVMLTYGIAQFLITEGSLRNLRRLDQAKSRQ